MAVPAIRVSGVGKRYQVAHEEGRPAYRTLKESVAAAVTAPFRRRAAGAPPAVEDFWAVNDVSFEVLPGEVVGVIGRNGAGKSTLLKLLSRITRPTTGRIEINGRVGSLLEVGTGFHPELTGRENIYLNGSILGMARREIDRKFDEIVAFSEVEKFLDTPVKRFSSGMYVRLAFAVAAHLDPEILILDEVLAVGDATFQKKCLGKMGEVAAGGRTVVFVSHSMDTITRLCPRAVLMDAGRVAAAGPTPKVVAAYLHSGLGTTAAREWADPKKAPGNDVARLRAVRVRTADGTVTETADIRQPVWVEIEYDVLTPGRVLVPNFQFTNQDGLVLFHPHDWGSEWRTRPRPVGRYTSAVKVPGNLLAEGTFTVGVAVSSYNPVVVHVHEREAVAFQVVDSLDGDSARGDYANTMPGVIRPILDWETAHTA